MANVSVTITEITDCGAYPLWAEARLTDRFGKDHVFRDKLPIFTAEEPSEVSCEGIIRCVVEEEREGFCIVDTTLPDDVEDDEGCTRFEVAAELVSSERYPARGDSPDCKFAVGYSFACRAVENSLKWDFSTSNNKQELRFDGTYTDLS